MCQHLFRPSQRFVLVKQSDSPCPRQFKVLRYSPRARAPLPAPLNGASHPNVKAPGFLASTQHPNIKAISTAIPRPEALSQSFSRSYGSNFPTSLTYIILPTRAYSARRPDAVISTTRRDNNSRCRIFKDYHEHPRHPEKERCFPRWESLAPGNLISGTRSLQRCFIC